MAFNTETTDFYAPSQDNTADLGREMLTDNHDDGQSGLDYVPDSYEMPEMPEGMPVDSSLMEALEPVMRDLKLTQGQFRALAETYRDVMAAQIGDVRQMAEQWQREIVNDREIGGRNFNANLERAVQRVYRNDRLFSPALRQALESSGLNNHPEMVRLAIRLDRAFNEDSAFLGDGAGSSGKKGLVFKWD